MDKPLASVVVAPGSLSDAALDGARPALMVPAENPVQDVEIGEVPMAAIAMSVMCLPLLPFTGCGFYTVDAKSEAAILHMGVLTEMQGKSGLHCAIPCGMAIERISVKQCTVDLPSSKIVDGIGNPVQVSAILNYRVVDSKKALLNVQNYKHYVQTNAQGVLKQIVSMYSYEQLKTEAEEVNARMRATLLPLVAVAGIEVSTMRLNDLSYAPEIASAMLKRQQARALVDARTLIVEGAVKISQDAIAQLTADHTMELTDEQKVKIVTNLLTVTCSDTDATPTVALS